MPVDTHPLIAAAIDRSGGLSHPGTVAALLLLFAVAFEKAHLLIYTLTQ